MSLSVPYTRCDLTGCRSSLGNISNLSNGTGLPATDYTFYAISGGSTLGNDKRALIQVSNGTAFVSPADIACGSAGLTTASFGTYIELNNGENCTLSWTGEFNGTPLSYSRGSLQRDNNGNYLLKSGTLTIDTAPTITGGDTLDINVEEGQASVTDVAASDGYDRLTYSLSGGADQGKFAIDTNTGALTFQTAPDHASPTDADTNNIYVVEVTVTDSGGQTASQTINVSVTEANSAPAITSNGGGDTATVSMEENQPNVTTVTATDPNTGDTLAYSLNGTDQAQFAIDASTGALTFSAAPDFENPGDNGGDNTYEVVVTVTDSGNLTDTQTITVNVTNVNENPAITSNGGGDTASVSMVENQTSATTVAASDSDTGDTLAYSLSGGADQEKFAIDASSGALTFNTAPDYENPADSDTNNTYVVEVTVTDSSNLTDTQTITVTVTDEDDNAAPAITSNGGGDTASVSVAENQTSVTTVAATDPDTSDTLTYSLSGGADQSKFAIDASSGVLTFQAAPDYESPTDANTDNSYKVEVTVTDSGNLTDTQTITVTVTDVDEIAPTVSITHTKGDTLTDMGGFNVAFNWDETVTGFTQSDIGISNASISGFTETTAGRAYQATFTPDGQGDIRIDIAAGAAQDAANNDNKAATLSMACGLGCGQTQTVNQTQQAIRNLTGKHMINMTSQGPGLVGLMSGTGFGGQGFNGLLGELLPMTLNHHSSNNHSSGSFALSMHEMQRWQHKLQNNLYNTPAARPGEARQPDALGAAQSPVNVWVKGRWTEASDDRGGIDEKSDFGMVFLGADYRYDDDLIFGVMAQVDWFDEKSSGLGVEGKGDGWMIGPYLVSRLKDNLILDTRIAWGQSDNQINPLGTYWDNYETERWQVETNLTGSFDYDAWHIAPSLGLSYFEEKQKAYTDHNGFTIGEQTSRLGSLSFGPTLYYNIQQGNGTTIRPMFGLKGIWDFEAPDITDINGNAINTEGLRGQAKVGLNVSLPNDMTVQGSYTYDGIGISEFESHTLELILNTPLQIEGLPTGTTLRGSYSMLGEDLFSNLSQLSNEDMQRFMLEVSVPFD